MHFLLDMKFNFDYDTGEYLSNGKENIQEILQESELVYSREMIGICFKIEHLP